MAASVRDDLLSTLLPCSFGGVPFGFESGTVTGGHRATERPILNSSEQILSNVGLRQRAYAIRGYIAARESIDAATGEIKVVQSYAEHRRALLAAFENPEPQTLVHPIEGAIQGLLARSFAIDETPDEWGRGSVSVEFIRDTRRPTPVPDLGVASAVVAAAEKAKASFLESLAEKWGVDISIVGSFEDGLTKAREAFDSVQTIANEAETLTDSVDALAAVTSEGIAAAATLITLPQRLATSIGNAVSVLASVFPTVSAAFEGMILGFSFGDVDFTIDGSTPSAQLRRDNAAAMNATMKGVYLAEAYRFASGLDFLTLDEIERVEVLLDDQFNAIIDLGSATTEAIDTLENLRTAFASLLDRARLSARKTVQEDVSLTTPRVLAHDLYEDDALTETIAGLNGVFAYEALSGRVTVLSS